MNFVFHPEAETEFNETTEYYGRVELGLGLVLLLKFIPTTQRSVPLPKAWSTPKPDTNSTNIHLTYLIIIRCQTFRSLD